VGNQARAYQGLIQLGMIVGMAARLIAGLVIPDAWGVGRSDAPVIPAVSLAVVRVAYTGLYLYAAAGDRRLLPRLLPQGRWAQSPGPEFRRRR
jgi:hypothetical protein